MNKRGFKFVYFVIIISLIVLSCIWLYQNVLNNDGIKVLMDDIQFNNGSNRIIINGDRSYRYMFSVSDESVAVFKRSEVSGIKIENELIIKEKGFVNAFIQVIDNNRIIKTIKKELTICNSFNSELNINNNYTLYVDDEISIINDDNNVCLRNVSLTTLDKNIIKVYGNKSIKGLMSGQTVLNISSGNSEVSTNIIVREVGSNQGIPPIIKNNIKVSGIEVNEKNINIGIGEKYQLLPIIKPDNATNRNIAYVSDDLKVAKVDNNGIIEAIGFGNCNIKIVTIDGNYTTNVKVNVTNNNVKVSSINFDIDKIDLKVGDTKKINPIISPINASNKSIQYSINNINIASISNDGTIVAKNKGTAIITATTYDGNKQASIMVNVRDVEVDSISLNITSAEIKVGGSLNLYVTLSPINATNRNIIWSSSDSSIAEVKELGKIVGKKEGTAIITVKTADGSKQATCRLVVKSNEIEVENVSLNTTSDKIKVGDKIQLEAFVSPLNATNKLVTWTSSNPNVASVSNSGLVTAKSIGTTAITVTTTDGKKNASASIEVVSNSVAVTKITLNKTSGELKIGESLQLIATISPSNATTKSVTWKSSNENIATVVNGLVVGKAQGNAVIYAISNDNKNILATCNIVVKNNEISVDNVNINITNATLKVGDTLDLIATILPSNATNKSVIWKSSDSSIASVSASGRVTAKKAGNVTITVTTIDGNKIATSNIMVTNIAVTGISLNKNSATLKVNETVSLIYTISPSNATNKTVTWTSSNPSVASVSNSGLVTANAQGNAIITVTTNDGNKSAAASIMVTSNDIVVTSISLNKTSETLTIGNTSQLSTTIMPTNATDKGVFWSSSNTSVATVSTNGLVTAKSVGTATITVSTNNNKIATYTVTVIKNNESINVTPMSTGFEITYYWGIPANKLTDTNIKQMKESGITIAHLRSNPDGINDTVAYRRNMDLAINKLNSYGIKVIVVDNYTLLNRIRDYQTDEEAIEKIKDMVNFYSKYANVIGYEIIDEPSVKDFNRLAKIVSYIRQNDSKRLAYINLFPNYATSEQLGTQDYYTGYLKKFIDTVNPQILSVDHYPSMFHGNNTNSSKIELYNNAQNMKDLYNQKGVPPMIISLVTKHWYFRDITANEIAFEISTNLAFGMKRLSYYTYSIDNLTASNAFVDANYNRTSHYYDVQNINSWARSIGNQLYSKKVSNIYGINEVSVLANYNSSNKVLGSLTAKRLTSGSTIPAIMSIYNDNSILLVNTDFSSEQGIFTLDGVNGNLYNMQWFDPNTSQWKNITQESGNNDVWLMPASQRIAIVPGHCILLRKK